MAICPDAYIFNFSNPMTAIVTTVKRAFPQARFIGICHEIGWLTRWLPPILGMDPREYRFRAAGLNHFSCLLEIKEKKTGKDLYPEVRRKAPAFFEREPGYSDMLDVYRATGKLEEAERFVITSYSIHYTKLYDFRPRHGRLPGARGALGEARRPRGRRYNPTGKHISRTREGAGQ